MYKIEQNAEKLKPRRDEILVIGKGIHRKSRLKTYNPRLNEAYSKGLFIDIAQGFAQDKIAILRIPNFISMYPSLAS